MKRAIVIGASSGIGREVSKLLLADGWIVGVAARREDRLMEIKSANPGMVEVMRIDVTAADAPGRLLELARRLGGVSLFVYCSGVGRQNAGLDSDVELSTVDVNVKGFTAMVDTMFNYMAKGLGVAPSYSATKAYQNTYIQALEQLSNMRRLHLRFTDIRPGFVDTDLLSGSGGYPMLMDKETVARQMLRAIYAHRHVHVIDWRYRLLVFAWRLMPRWLWRKLNITNRKMRNQE